MKHQEKKIYHERKEKKENMKARTDTDWGCFSPSLSTGLGQNGMMLSFHFVLSCASQQERTKWNYNITSGGPGKRHFEEMASSILQSRIAKASVESSLEILKRKVKSDFKEQSKDQE